MTSMSVGELSLFLCGNGLYLWVEMASTSVGELSLFLCGNNLVGARMDSISVREWPRRSRNVLYLCAGISSVSVREKPLSISVREWSLSVGGNDLYVGG
ncbi:hypothetical protein CDAR_60751 [Caerostris darwini]|uniref:Uncharacterized protein n=1 Tax=Caerostris darwini TaxID=1538125 RepID=A0AAV4VIG6_9ARAC|nr:hypothetical protein CDAR_60751 [Caerostris darwini]